MPRASGPVAFFVCRTPSSERRRPKRPVVWATGHVTKPSGFDRSSLQRRRAAHLPSHRHDKAAAKDPILAGPWRFGRSLVGEKDSRVGEGA